MNNIKECQISKNDKFQTLLQIFLTYNIISNNFENVLLEQIIIVKYTVGNLNNIDRPIYENIVTFVHILGFLKGKQYILVN